MDKNQATINYLLTCEPIYNTPLYFNFANIKDNVNQFLTLTSDKNIEEPYIDGSIKKMFSLTIISYLTISNNPIVKIEGINNENVDDMATVQALIDWIDTQNENRNFPNFGEDCFVDKISTTTNNPRLDQIDATQSTPLARYSFTIQIEYIDNSKKLWK